MSAFANQLKSEISRLAKKEVRTETQVLKKVASQNRNEISLLKKRLAAIEASLKKLSKAISRGHAEVMAKDESGSALRFRSGGFASLRKKLGISAAEMGQLLGVSAQSVYHWEAGKTKPRSSQLQAIASVRKMGKREVAEKLNQADSSAAA